jgi:hypothetical protein
MYQDYVPGNDGGKLIWTKNLEDKFAVHASTLGLSEEELLANQQLCIAIRDAINNKVSAQATAKKAKVAGDAIVTNHVKALRKIVQALKTKAGYTEAIGEDMHVIGAESAADINTFKTTLTAKIFSGRVEIDFVKGISEGINVYTRFKGQPSWTKLSFDAYSPYIDTRPLAVANTPEYREYMALGVVADAEIGQPSDIIAVVFGG